MKQPSNILLFLASALWAGWGAYALVNLLAQPDQMFEPFLIMIITFGALFTLIAYLGKKFAWNQWVLAVLVLIPVVMYAKDFLFA